MIWALVLVLMLVLVLVLMLVLGAAACSISWAAMQSARSAGSAMPSRWARRERVRSRLARRSRADRSADGSERSGPTDRFHALETGTGSEAMDVIGEALILPAASAE